MLVKLNGNVVSVMWRYDTDLHDQKITTCIIKEGIGKEAKLLSEGRAVCNVHDQFCKNSGRKVAMHKALHNVIGYPKQVRRLFWTAYQDMRNGNFL